jgi:hypothetical protein
MGVIPEELIKDAPSFTEFLAFYTKSQAEWKQEQVEWKQKQKEWQERWEREQKEWERKREEREREQKKWREEREREQKDWDRRWAEITAQTAENNRQFARFQENLGGLNRSMGELIETLIAARLWEKFPEYGLQRAYRRLPVYNEKNIAKAEIDILLVNTEWAMAVEVKREVDRRDVDWHIERMARILQYPPALLPSNVKLLGAIAGGVVEPAAIDYAHSCGFYVLDLAGESVVRLPDPPGFKPREW